MFVNFNLVIWLLKYRKHLWWVSTCLTSLFRVERSRLISGSLSELFAIAKKWPLLKLASSLKAALELGQASETFDQFNCAACLLSKLTVEFKKFKIVDFKTKANMCSTHCVLGSSCYLLFYFNENAIITHIWLIDTINSYYYSYVYCTCYYWYYYTLPS